MGQPACSQHCALSKEHLDEPIAEPGRRSRSPVQYQVDEPTLEPGQAVLPERTVQQLVQELEQSPVLVQPVRRTQSSIQQALDEQIPRTIPRTILQNFRRDYQDSS